MTLSYRRKGRGQVFESPMEVSAYTINYELLGNWKLKAS
jgi:hypothetical protein